MENREPPRIADAESIWVLAVGGLAWETKVFTGCPLSTNEEQRAEAVVDMPGGSGWCLTASARMLGCRSQLWSRVGADDLSTRLLDRLTQRNIEFLGTRYHASNCLQLLTIIRAGNPAERFFVDRLPAWPNYLPPIPDDAPGALIMGYSSPWLVERAAETDLRHNVLKVANLSGSIRELSANNLFEVLSSYHLVTLNEDELAFAARLLSRPMEGLLEELSWLGPTVVMTSERGLYRVYRGGRQVLSGQRLFREIGDATGAGDAFAVGMSCAVVAGWSLNEAVAIALDLAEYYCRRSWEENIGGGSA